MQIDSFEFYLMVHSDLKLERISYPKHFVQIECNWLDLEYKATIYTYGNNNFVFVHKNNEEPYVSIPIKKISNDDFTEERIGSPICQKIVQYIKEWRSLFEE